MVIDFLIFQTQNSHNFRRLKELLFRCIDRCAARKSLETFGKISTSSYFITNKEFFTEKEWSENYLDFSYDLSNIIKNCTNQFAELKLCNEVKYEPGSATNRLPNTVSLELYHPLVSSVEVEPSWYKLLLDLLTVQSLIFGFTAIQLLTIGGKLPLLFVYLVCLFGFSWHTYHVFDLAISSELTPSQFYEAPERMRMPEVLFCFQIDTSLINESSKLTGHYLEQLTSDMTAESIFDHIAYLNDSKWISLSKESGFRDSAALQISTFFFLDCKCFNIWLNEIYHRNEFHFSSDPKVLQINFSKHAKDRFHSKVQHTHFMTKSRGKLELSKIAKIAIDFNESQISVSHEAQEVAYEDRFNTLKRLFKDPLSLFQDEYDANDVDLFARRLLVGFLEAHRKVTRNLPIGKSLFKYEIDDRLFEEYFNQTQAVPMRTNFNYRREFAVNHLRTGMKNYVQHNADLVFRLIYVKKVILTTNDDNYTKLLLNLFNVLSSWFGIDTLILPAYLLKFKQIFAIIRRLIFRVYKFFSER